MLTACSVLGGGSGENQVQVSTTHNPTGEEMLNLNPEADIFMFGDLIYENADTLDWVQQFKFEGQSKVGEITAIYRDQENFTNGMSTKLPVGTEIFRPSPHQFSSLSWTVSNTAIWGLLKGRSSRVALGDSRSLRFTSLKANRAAAPLLIVVGQAALFRLSMAQSKAFPEINYKIPAKMQAFSYKSTVFYKITAYMQVFTPISHESEHFREKNCIFAAISSYSFLSRKKAAFLQE
ncbi:hypothetical protein RE628_06055 [Paenibacillus sp. D2_2]|uniref:hypothetical protein n=1 Tax=Paenibacillus sp. D2_2 TaxID=3073092 RepID=UPI0028162C9E|nr:hypothetical protein [Paenibacillus sp. D2_2]WMT42000.1 hypothetical protein RE628_06055 [Paenibacillus sp. D2_2]